MNYTLGNAKTAISAGRITELDIPYISFELIESNDFKIKDSLLGTDAVTTNKTVVFIKNLEGLSVLEKALKIVKARLKEQNKKL